MKKILSLMLIACLCLPLAACAETQEVDTSTAVSTAAKEPDTADPEKALDKIMENVEIQDITIATEQDLEDLFAIDTDLLEDFAVFYTSGRYGIANAFILKPIEELPQTDSSSEANSSASSSLDIVSKTPASVMLDSLSKLQFSLIEQTENYDIYNAHQIAQNALVFEQGDYVIMLMVEDLEGARAAIDKYIPKK